MAHSSEVRLGLHEVRNIDEMMETIECGGKKGRYIVQSDSLCYGASDTVKVVTLASE